MLLRGLIAPHFTYKAIQEESVFIVVVDPIIPPNSYGCLRTRGSQVVPAEHAGELAGPCNFCFQGRLCGILIVAVFGCIGSLLACILLSMIHH
jgi:hypothetical protein